MNTESSPINIAIFGAGIFAKERHIPALKHLIEKKVISVKAIYSRTQQSAEDMKALLHSTDVSVYFGGEERMVGILQRSDIQAVDIVMPILLLPKCIELCFKYGKHVISEKPIAPTIQEGRRLIDLHQKNYSHLVWSVAENYRYMKSFLEASAVMKAGTIGKVLLSRFDMRGHIGLDGKYFNTDWRKIPGYQGGFLLDGGVHHMAFIRLLLGEVKQLSAEVTQLQIHLPPADTISASFTFENGSLGSVNSSFGLAKNSDLQIPMLTIFGENGTLKVTRDCVEITEVTAEETKYTKRTFNVDYELEPIILELEGFLQQVRGGAKDRNSPQEALSDLALIEGILEAGAHGGVVKPEHF